MFSNLEIIVEDVNEMLGKLPMNNRDGSIIFEEINPALVPELVGTLNGIRDVARLGLAAKWSAHDD